MLEKERSAMHTVTERVAPIWSKQIYWHCGFVTHSACSCKGFWGIGVQGEAPHVSQISNSLGKSAEKLLRITGPDHQNLPPLHPPYLSNGVAACIIEHMKKLLQ